MKLIIVESPTKSNTIQKFLDKNYKVLSSYGHVRDLPEKKLGIDIEHNFEPQYVILPKAKKRVIELKSEAKKSEEVILATDEDREGEAISWHLVQALNLETHNVKHETKNNASGFKLQVPRFKRIVFHEITKSAIENALKNPRDIDMKLVNAQQARRILDRLVGYKLSPFLWKKIARGLSAGRIQSVAVRLVAERERDVLDFKPKEYWTITAKLLKSDKEFGAQLIKIADQKIDKFFIADKNTADTIVSGLNGANYRVEKITKKEVSRQPLPPFTTSTMQQTAFNHFGFSAKQTMMLAQGLYETGLITYMRTDSVNLSKESIEKAILKIKNDFGAQYTLPSARVYKTKSKSAQEAHEAIRPTEPSQDPDSIENQLTPQQRKLYDLIWKRFIATQMANAILESTAIDITADKSEKNYTFHASGSVVKFDGFLKIYPQKTAEINLPILEEKEELKLKELKPEQHFTEPPARYNEASLIKALEEYGIGRPSTYAPIMSTIQTRRYVIKDEGKRLKPTDMGILVNDILVVHFPKIVDLEFTARMEENLDNIASDNKEWQQVIKEFWVPFKENLEKKTLELNKKEIAMEKTDLECPECGKYLVIRMGRYGKFYACTGCPECKYTAPLEPKEREPQEDLGLCSKCGTGKIVKRRTKKGRTFWGCSSWPKCDWASWENPRKNEE